MSIPSDCHFTDEHEWVRQENGNYRIGISDYAQTELGDVVFVELPEVGREITKGEAFCNVESVKAVSDVYAPIDGTVIAVNDNLESAPETLNSSPYEDGWIIEISAANSEQVESLKDSEQYKLYIEELSK